MNDNNIYQPNSSAFCPLGRKSDSVSVARDYHAENQAKEAEHKRIAKEILEQFYNLSRESHQIFYTRNGKQMPICQENEAA